MKTVSESFDAEEVLLMKWNGPAVTRALTPRTLKG